MKTFTEHNETPLFVHHLFELQQTKTPLATAVCFGKEKLSYTDLNKRAENLSQVILSSFPDEAIIAISATKSIELVVGVLAILKSGKAYLPLDVNYPTERLQHLIKDSSVNACLTNKNEASLFKELELSVIAIDEEYPLQEVQPKFQSSIVCVLHTSGSTGKPKGVLIGHKGLVNLLQWQARKGYSKEGTKSLLFAHLSFDASIQEMFVPLATGGTLMMINDEIRLNAHKLLHFIDEEGINRVDLPVVALQYLAEAAEAEKFFPGPLQEVVTGGDQLKLTPQIVKFFAALPGCILVNSYGPTEASVQITEHELSGKPETWPVLPSIGKPIQEIEIFIIDENLNLVADGNEGELCISGVCLAEGYLNNPELTAEKFINWCHPEKGNKRIYRTGDIARHLNDGNIEFLGRKDQQIKIRGYRIEPGEVEIALIKLEEVKEAVVIATQDATGQKKLIAYLIASGIKKDSTELAKQLEKVLPYYMVPSAFVWMDEIPKTITGKVNRKALPLPEFKRPDLAVLYREPATIVEKQLAKLWIALLQLNRAGTEDNFFELGGNSLLAVKTITELRLLGYELPVAIFYEQPTIKAIAAFLDDKKRKGLKSVKQKRQNDDQHEIAVIGLAARFPGANNIQEFWSLLKDGKEAIRFFSDEELDASISQELKDDPKYVKGKGIIDHVKEFDAPFFGINSRLAELMDPQHRVFLEIAWEVLENAGYSSDDYENIIGVFAGCENNTYYTNNVLSNKNLIENVGNLQVVTVNDKDYLSTRTAYSLNLKGPAVTVQSACSTSLLAIAQAVESIRKGQCDMALAGGVAVTCPTNSGHLYQEGAMLSKDGHCRPFDVDAQGTVFSDGAGVVLLKSRKKAEEDGDEIYAVIKGVGVNNDGGGKASFTAPSTEGQAGAIKMAFEDAAIDPSTISYIEAHGTATPLGDPIEIEGLNRAFGLQQKKQFCALGSVKSNIGHLSTAAGVAGFIKAVLALHYKQIPPSINFQKANPNIKFEDSPFYVNATLHQWQSDSIRRAGVSSFGVGGTNVHAVLEEYVFKKTETSESKPLHLINWSAKTEKSRDQYAQKLASYFAEDTDTDLADISYTFKQRPDFNCRRFIIAANHQQAIERLNLSPLPSDAKVLKEAFNGLVFMFPGQGAQYINMGLELFSIEPVFKNAVDECARLLQRELNEDIRKIIFPEHNHEDAEARLKKTCFAQPALFTIEYALAQLWMSWGIKPDLLVGHSVGEFVAAHLAGVFNLEDALKLIAARGQMMNELPAGGMLSVRMAATKIQALLPQELSIAAINSPELCVVSGPDKAIKSFSDKLNKEEIPNRLLHTSHAFHSAMMDPIVEPFKAVVQTIDLRPNTIPIMSTVTGNWLTEAEATDPAYWANHLRATVRFSNAIHTLCLDNGRLLLEVGPKNTTATLVRQQVGAKVSGIVSTLEIGDNEKAEYASVLRAMGQLWLHGAAPDWKAFYGGQKRAKLQLPNYVFDRKQCWVEPKEMIAATVNNENRSDQNKPEEHIEISLVALPHRKESLVSKIKEILEDASGFEASGFGPDMNFIELGFDSLLLTQIALTLKKEFNIPVSFRMLNTECNTLNLLSDYLDANLPENIFAPQAPAPIRNENLITAKPPELAPAGNATLETIAYQLQMLTNQVALLQGQSLPGTVKDSAASQKLIQPAKGYSGKETNNLSHVGSGKVSVELNKRQLDFLQELTIKYTKKTAGSKAYAQKHRSYMADQRVVAGFKPATKEIIYPIVANKSKGSKIWDIDGNEYIDIVNGFGSSLLGYQPEIITKAVQQQIEKGFEIGPQHELAGEVCKLICELTHAERAAFCSTGSEAVLGAIRIARTVTGRSLIVSFNGSYHGLFDEVSVRGTKKNKSQPSIPGVMPEAVQNILVLDYGTDEALKIIKERAHELAAVLVEPVQSARPEFQPIEFLKELRQMTEASGTALIFDELITGFRTHAGGTQALFGIQADINCYGKAIAGGMPMGVVAGKKRFIDALDGGFWQYGDDSVPEIGMTYFAATFDRHPLALASARALLNYLKEKGQGLQESINAKTERLANSVNEFCSTYNLPLCLVNFGSLFKVKFSKDVGYGEVLYTILRCRGIHIYDVIPCFLTEAHTEEDIDTIIQAFKESIAEMIDADFLPFLLKKQTRVLKEPPISGARLGKDADGDLAWFIDDPKRPGKYLKLELKN